MKKWSILFIVLLVAALAVGCGNGNNNNAGSGTDSGDSQSPVQPGELILATTTSTYDSGLLDYLLPFFEEESGYEMKVVSLGTGQALETAKNGDADVVLVHAKTTELEMVEQGHFTDRHDVMYNDFVVVGMEEDPAGLKEIDDIAEVFAALAESQIPFISRGDDSGTHLKELSLWESAGISPEGNWYVDAGSGMGDTLRMADEMEGYTLTDRATYLSLQESLDLVIVYEGNPQLFNQYGVMAVNPGNYPELDYAGSLMFIEFLISDRGQELIANFQPFGGTLFFPNAD